MAVRGLLLILSVCLLIVVDAGKTCYRNGVEVDCKTKQPIVKESPLGVPEKVVETVVEVVAEKVKSSAPASTLIKKFSTSTKKVIPKIVQPVQAAPVPVPAPAPVVDPVVPEIEIVEEIVEETEDVVKPEVQEVVEEVEEKAEEVVVVVQEATKKAVKKVRTVKPVVKAAVTKVEEVVQAAKEEEVASDYSDNGDDGEVEVEAEEEPVTQARVLLSEPEEVKPLKKTPVVRARTVSSPPPESVHKKAPAVVTKKKAHKKRAARCFKAGVMIDCETKEPIVDGKAAPKMIKKNQRPTKHPKPTVTPAPPVEDEYYEEEKGDSTNSDVYEEDEVFEIEVDLQEKGDGIVAAPTHATMTQLQSWNIEDAPSVKEWLETIGLGDYFDRFQAAGFDDLELLSVLSPEEREDMFNQLDLKLGHKFKLRRALSGLGNKIIHHEESLYVM